MLSPFQEMHREQLLSQFLQCVYKQTTSGKIQLTSHSKTNYTRVDSSGNHFQTFEIAAKTL